MTDREYSDPNENSFVLKVIDDENTGNFVPDTRHIYGGYNMLQANAFTHLFPDGFCPWVYRQLVFDMAAIHGWRVEVRTVQKGELQ